MRFTTPSATSRSRPPALLSEDQRAGAELEFDVVEEKRRGGPALYRYEPLTEEYIDSPLGAAARPCPPAPAAASALGAGAAQYLRVNGVRGGEAEPALRAMLERLYEDATSFVFPEERFEAVYAEVERTLYRDTTRTAVVAPLLRRRARAGAGGARRRPRARARGALRRPARGGRGRGHALRARARHRARRPAAADEAAERFRALERGMRLYKPGAVALGALALDPAGRRALAAGRPRPRRRRRPRRALDPGGRRGGAELLEFLGAIGGRGLTGDAWRGRWPASRWAARATLDAEALSDYLLALRALLDADYGGRATPASRCALAALCAEEDERRIVQRRVELALALERFVMAGGRGDDYVERVGSESPRMLVSEIERHLRALLRDVLCGYLEPDLKGVADDILLKAAEPVDRARPTTLRRRSRLWSPILRVRRLTPERAETPTSRRGGPGAARGRAAAARSRTRVPTSRAGRPEPRAGRSLDGVTPRPTGTSYSAPV